METAMHPTSSTLAPDKAAGSERSNVLPLQIRKVARKMKPEARPNSVRLMFVGTSHLLFDLTREFLVPDAVHALKYVARLSPLGYYRAPPVLSVTNGI